MNLVFWGKEHPSVITAHMMAVTGVLRASYGEAGVVVNRFLPENSARIALCDCGTGQKGRRRHFLWHANLTIVNLKPDRVCIEHFLESDFHIAKRMMFLLEGYDCEADAAMAYMQRTYRIEPERMALIPYNGAFYEALAKGKSDSFIARELCAPENFTNEQFIRSVQTAAARMLCQVRT